MAKVLSLKTFRDSNTLKSEIRTLEDDKLQILEQVERHKLFEQKLRDDLLEQKKDFEHLEKQFEHFAQIEAEYEALQSQVQMDRLEQMIDSDKKDSQHKSLVQKSKEEIKLIQSELKELKKLDPTRLKRQVGDLKKKAIAQSAENKTVNSALVTSRKELKEMTTEKDKLDSEFKSSQKKTDFFWQSKDSEWLLFETGLILNDEEFKKDEEPTRIQCLNSVTGVSALSNELLTKGKKKDLASWFGDIKIPDDVSKEAGKRLKKIATDLEESEE